MTVISLPFPVSTNNLFKNLTRGGRAKTERYTAWLAEAALALRGQRAVAIKGSFRLRLSLERPDWRRRDLSNLIKAPEDFLVSQGIIEDDSFAQSIHVEWADVPPAKPGRLRISIEEA